MIARLLYASAVFLIAALPARAQTVDVSVLINDPGSAGCDVTPPGLPVITGVEAQLTATVDRLAAQVINVDLFVCTGAAFGPPTSVGGGQPLGNDNGFNGADVVEMSVPRAMVTPSGNSLRVAAVADNGVGVDATSLGALGAPVTAVPGPGVIGLSVLALLILALAWIALRRQRVLMSLLLVGLSFAVLAMNFMVDGQVGDWASVPPVALDPPGDGTNGETAVDIVALFAGQEDQGGGLELFFRVDMADLIINNQLPVAADDALATDEDNPVSGDLFADNGNGVDSDPDSDPFTVTMVNGTATVGAAVNLPSGAQVTVNADGTFTYDPLAAFNSLSQGQITTDTFTYTIDDAIAGSDQATATVTITGVNDVGTAVDDPAYATGEDTPLNQAAPGVLGNDTDPDTNDTLTAVLDTGPTSALSFTLNPDGSFSYTPALNFNGPDSFTYHFNDGVADSNMATATINVGGVNDPPVGVDDSGDATDEDTPITTQNVLTNDTDVDLDLLSVASADAFSAQGAAITDNGDGSFNYDPTTSAALNALSVGQMTTDTFSYTVTDGLLNDTATVSVAVAGVNDLMIANDDSGAGFATDEDTSFTTGNVLGNDTDPDAGDTLSVMSADATSAQGAAITDLGNGTFTYDPTSAAALQALATGAMVTDTFGYVGTDSNGSTDPATVSIDVTGINDAPVIAFPTGGAVFSNMGPVNIDPAAILTDVDSPDFNTGDFTVSLGLSADPMMCDVNDVLTVENQGMGATQIGFDGVNVSYEGTQFGTVTTPYLCTDLGGGLFDIQPLLIAFDPDASIAAVTALLQALQYNTTSADDQDREASAMVTDGDGGTSNAALATITVNLNQPPVITSDGGGATAMVNAAENQTAVTTVTATDADIPAQTLTFSISGGADQALFSIGAASGVLTFNSSPDFENPTDAGTDNVYDVQVTVTDDGTPNQSDSQDIAVTVTDVNDAPVITSDGGGATASVNAAENQTAVTTVTATDEDLPAQTLTFSITGGADQALFGIGAASGVLTFNSAPDFENPTDAGANNVYDVQVTVTDDGAPNLSDVQDIAVTVTNVNDAPLITSDGGGATAMINAAENQTGATTTTATDSDLPAQTLTFSITGGADQALFGIGAGTGVLTFNAPPNFESPADAGANGIYDVQVTVTDNGTPNLSDMQDIAVTVVDVNDAPVITSDGGGATASVNADENQTAVTTVTATDADLPAQTLTFSITGGADQALFGIVAGTGVLTFNSAPDFENPADAGMNNVYDVQVTVTDNGAPNLSDVQDVAVTVNDLNEPPTAMDESFAVQSNVGIAPNAMNGLLANDSDPEGSLTLLTVGVDLPTTAGGLITTAADGSFTYTPQAGDAAVMDTFAYQISDGANPAVGATATFNVDSNTIWFVDLDAGTMGDGTLNEPFDSLADLDNGGPDADGSTIFHYSTTMGAQTDALSNDFDLQAGQFLIGEGATGAVTINALRGFTTHPFSLTLPSIGAAANHTITATNDAAIQLGMNNTIRGLNIGNTGTGPGIRGSGFGTLTIDDVSISGTGGILDLSTGTVSDPTGGDFTFGSLVTTSNPGIGINLNAVGGAFTVDTVTSITGTTGTLGIDIDGASGSFDFGATTIGGMAPSTDAGIDISTGGTGTFTFDSLDVTNDNGTGLRANNGGTINIAGTTSTIDSTGGPGIDITSTSLGGGATFASVSSSMSVEGISLDSVTGSLTMNGGSIMTSSGIAFDLNAGSSNVTYAGSITNTMGLTVDVTGRMGGTATFSGSLSGTGPGTGINLTGNGTGTITFSGGVTLNTSTTTAFNATGGGTVNVTGAGNTLTTTTGVALNVVGTNIGGSDMTFQSISANGAVSGIVLNGTGTSGGVTITGDGGNTRNASGGTIQNTTSHGISLTSTDSFSATSMDLTSPGDGVLEHGINAVNITGNGGLFRAGRITDVISTGDGIRIVNTNINLGLFEVRDSLFSGVSAAGNDGIFVNGLGSSVMRIDVVGTSKPSAADCANTTGTTDVNQFDSIRGDGVQVNPEGTSVVTLNLRNSCFTTTQNNASDVSRYTSLLGTSGELRATIEDNLFQDTGTQPPTLPVDPNVGVVDFVANDTSTFRGRLNTNFIEDVDVEVGMRHVGDDNAAEVDIVIDNNDINNIVDQEAIFVYIRDATQLGNVSITNNGLGTGANGTVGGGDDQPIDEHGIEFRVQSRNTTNGGGPNPNTPIVTHTLISGNAIVNTDTGSEAIDLDAEVDNPDGSSANPATTFNSTVINNILSNILDAEEEVAVDSEDGPAGGAGRSLLCVDLRSNTMTGGEIDQIDEDTGADLDMVQAAPSPAASANEVDDANGLPCVGATCTNIDVIGAPNFAAVGSCTGPTHTMF